MAFLLKIKEMKAKIAAGEDVYNNALLVGNAFYNASYFGNARAFITTKSLTNTETAFQKEHEKMLYGMENVSKYYNLAKKSCRNQ